VPISTADVTGDEVVDFNDYALMASNWQRQHDQISPEQADINSDGVVNCKDLALVMEGWLREGDFITEPVIVAVLDTGVDYNHPDIFDNIWVNPGEVDDRNNDGYIDLHDIDLDGNRNISQDEIDAASDGIDDDGNEYADDLFGWEMDFFSYHKTNNPMDEDGHGTHIAGTIAAVGNNNEGIIGVAPKAKIMALKTDFTSGTIPRLLYYAVDNGAKVINNSWGPQGRWAKYWVYNDFFDYVVDEKGAVLIFGAGNNDDDVQYYAPANHCKTIAVGSVDQNDVKSNFSNWGSMIDVVAPGGGSGSAEESPRGQRQYVNILSLRANDTDMYCEDPDDDNVCGELIVDDTYYRAKGTSMAAPHVSGAAALIFSKYPDATPTEIMWRLRLSADDIGEEGQDDIYGWGRINAYQALNMKSSPALVFTGYELSEVEGYCDGDGIVEPGERGQLVVTLSNEWKGASETAISLSTTTPQITIINSESVIYDIGQGESGDNAALPFIIDFSEEYRSYSEAEFSLSIDARGYGAEPAIFSVRYLFGGTIPDIKRVQLNGVNQSFNIHKMVSDNCGHI